MLTGIDISHYNTINQYHGETFVIHKATQGYNTVDLTYAARIKELRANGLLLGSYHYADGQKTGEVEAQHYLTYSLRQSGEIMALDIEGDILNHKSNLVPWCVEFLATVHSETGIWPLIYLNRSIVKDFDWTPVQKLNVGLWIASPGHAPTLADIHPWTFYAVWQNSPAPSVMTTGATDRDVFAGDSAAWHKYGTKPAVVSSRTVTVESGDSLSKIATRYGIPDWHTLYNLNKNTIGNNPDLIHPGQVLTLP